MDVRFSLHSLLVLFCLTAGAASAAETIVQLRIEETNTFLQVRGSPDKDWRFQVSSDLITWSNAPALGTLLSGGEDAPQRWAGDHTAAQDFFRAVQTDGFYDRTLFRTISLTFTQATWNGLLGTARSSGVNIYASGLGLDNGATNIGVGARYKGNTSYSMGGSKKSINVEVDWVDPSQRLMGYSTFNLNNAAGDETIMREPLYFTVMSQYTPCPRAAMARVHINGAFWGVYSLVQQENGQLINEWFPSNDGDRWRTPNAAGGGIGGGFSSSNAAMAYLNTTNMASYRNFYDLRTTNAPTGVAWERLIHAIYVLNSTPVNELRDRVEDVYALDSWLWFLALENLFADDDSYFNKGADYSFYYEIESGRIHPLEHDGNEAFLAGDVQLSPVFGATSSNRPMLYRLLSIAELRQRYLAHMRTVIREYYNPPAMSALINQFHALSISSILVDPNRSYSMSTYTNDLNALRTFVTNRYNFLTNHAELRPVSPTIGSVFAPSVPPAANEVPTITAQVVPYASEGIDSVWLYHRPKSYGRFSRVQMFDDGAHGDGDANDGLYGATTTNYPAGSKVRFYIEARSGNAARAASFAPARAEQQTFDYRVALTLATDTPVVINEFMAANTNALADPQGEFDDWIELRNITDAEVDLTGHYLSDEPNNPRKWQFPDQTIIRANGYLLVWADEDGLDTSGLHASFKLSQEGEELFLTDTDLNLNAVLDTISFGAQETDRSYGRTAADSHLWGVMDPTPEAPNH